MSLSRMKPILLAIAYSCTIPLLSAQTHDAPIRLLEQRLQKETKTVLPDFAPNLYKKAQESIAGLRETFVKERKLSDAQLRQANLQLEQYRKVAKKSQRRLKKAHALRLSALHRNFIRYYNPNLFYQAEQKYAEAILVGERQQFRLLRTHAKQATADYQTLVKSAQRNLKNQVKPALMQYRAAIKADLQALKTNTDNPDQIEQADEVFMRINPARIGISTDGTVLPPPFEPKICQGIVAATIPSPEERGAHSITILSSDNSTEETGNRVLRTTDLRNWQVVAELGILPRFDVFTYRDTGLLPSTRYCYNIETYNDKETCHPLGFLCTHTRDTDTIPIWRLVLKVQIANEDGAGTDDEVVVTIGDSRDPAYSVTFLDYGGDDFEEGSIKSYDLNLAGIRQLSDITSLAVNRDKGDDKMVIQRLTLFANDTNDTRMIFDRDFSSNSSTMPGSYPGTYTVDYDELRATPDWNKFVEKAKNDKTFNFPKIIFNPDGEGLAIQITNEEITSRIEALIGHMLYTNPALKGSLDWGHISGPPVEVTRIDDNTLHVDLDLEVPVDIALNPEMDIDFDLSVTKICREDTMVISIVSNNFTSNASASVWENIVNTSVGGILGLGLGDGGLSDITIGGLLGLGATSVGAELINWYTENCTTPPEINKELSMQLPKNIDCNALQVRIDLNGNLVICCFNASDF